MAVCLLDRIIAKQQKEYHNKKYINFRIEANKDRLTKDELETKLDTIIDKGYKYIEPTTKRARMPENSYSLTYNDRIIKLAIYDGKDYYWFTTDYRDDNKNKDTGSPFSDFKKRFKERTNSDLKSEFGATEQWFKVCCPQPLYYQSPLWAKETYINKVVKEDFSSHYPSNAISDLPDAKTAVKVDHYVEPNEEYPFAFYIKSGHIAVYNEFNSRNYIKEVKLFSARISKKREYDTNYELPKAKDETILMKKAKLNIKPEIEYYYNLKNNSKKDSQEYKDAKLFILKFIGMMEQCNKVIYKSYPFAHLAAVIKWRANIKTFSILKKIGYDKVIQVCVDGFIHRGKPQGGNVKALGNLITEFDNAKFIQKGINQYILEQDGIIERKTAGFDIDTESNDITDWKASSKVKFISYIKSKYKIKELK